MRELIGRLESTDDPAAGALRVIDHFDHLIEERAPVASVVRAAAALAGCIAGLRDASGLDHRFAPDGRRPQDEGARPPDRVAVPGRIGSWVWLERGDGAAGPLDPLILERAALTVQTLAGTSDWTPGVAIRLACDPAAAESDRLAALQVLGLACPVTVIVAVAAPPVARSTVLHSTVIGQRTVALADGDPALPPTLRAGTATAPEPAALPAALERARAALRLTDRTHGPGPSLVSHESLGALAVLAERVTPPEAGALADVRDLDRLLGSHPWVVDTLQAVLDQTSLRQAATRLHVHHSTLQERLAWLETKLGYAITRPGGRQRAAVAVLLWRIAHSEETAAED